MSNLIYVRLKDQGTTFHSAEQGVNAVANRIGKFKPTADVMAAINNGVLIKLKSEEAAPRYEKQEEKLAALRAKGDNVEVATKDKKEAATDLDEDAEADNEPADKGESAKATTKEVNTGKKK